MVPCFNEAEALPAWERELFPELERLGADWELLAVDDGSTDPTAVALGALAARRTAVRVLRHEANRGLGAALKTGLAAARGDLIACLDADLTFHPRFLKELLAAQRGAEADCVSGSPFLGGMPGVPIRRRLPSLVLNLAYRALFDFALTSYTPMFRLYRAEALRRLPLVSDGFELSAEIAARMVRASLRVIEVPVPLTMRTAGESKLQRLRELRNHARLLARLLAGG